MLAIWLAPLEVGGHRSWNGKTMIAVGLSHQWHIYMTGYQYLMRCYPQNNHIYISKSNRKKGIMRQVLLELLCRRPDPLMGFKIGTMYMMYVLCRGFGNNKGVGILAYLYTVISRLSGN